MRISAIADYYTEIKDILNISRQSCLVSHNTKDCINMAALVTICANSIKNKK